MTGTAMIMDKGLGHKIWLRSKISGISRIVTFMHLYFSNNTKFSSDEECNECIKSGFG